MDPHPYLHQQEVLKLAETDPEYAAWQKNNDLPNFVSEDPASFKDLIDGYSDAAFESLGDPGRVIGVPMRDGYRSPVRVYQPPPESSNSAVIVLIFGGAFVTGDNRDLAAYAVALRDLYHVTVVLPAYRLAPEHRFPTAQQDVWDTLVWLGQNARSVLDADPGTGFILSGVSAGANLAATLGQKWMDESRQPPVTGLWISIPIIFHGVDHVPAAYRPVYLSRSQNKHVPMNGEIPGGLLKALSPDVHSPLYSPVNSPSPHPPVVLARAGVRVYLQAAGQDVYRDDALIYSRILAHAGVATTIDIYPGVPHGHVEALPFTAAARRAKLDTLRRFAWLLRTTEPTMACLLAGVSILDRCIEKANG